MSRNRMWAVIAVCALAVFLRVFQDRVEAQTAPSTSTLNAANPNQGIQQILAYSGSNVAYVGEAFSSQNPSIITVSAASNANPVSFTATAHGFDYQSAATTTPVVEIRGATGNWTSINGFFVATPTSANAFTIAINSTTFSTLTGTLVVTTRAPRTAQTVWRIQKNVFDGSNNLIWSGWAVNPLSSLQGGSSAFTFAWASRTTYGYE